MFKAALCDCECGSSETKAHYTNYNNIGCHIAVINCKTLELKLNPESDVSDIVVSRVKFSKNNKQQLKPLSAYTKCKCQKQISLKIVQVP
jgi:hypothetical protein